MIKIVICCYWLSICSWIYCFWKYYSPFYLFVIWFESLFFCEVQILDFSMKRVVPTCLRWNLSLECLLILKMEHLCLRFDLTNFETYSVFQMYFYSKWSLCIYPSQLFFLFAWKVRDPSPKTLPKSKDKGCRVFQNGNVGHLHSLLSIESSSQVFYTSFISLWTRKISLLWNTDIL